LGADGTGARVRAARRGGWRVGVLALLAGALFASSGCNSSLEFHNRPIGGTGGTGSIAGTGNGGAAPGVGGAGGTGSGGSPATMVDAGPDLPVDQGIDIRPDIRPDVAPDVQPDLRPDVRDTGPDVHDTGVDTNGPVVCTANANCKLPGLVCLTTESRCVECVTSNDCAANSAAKTCDTTNHRCIECMSATDCPSVAVGEVKPSQCTANHQCLNGCDDSMPTTCPSKPAALVFACTSFGGGVSLCVYCTSNAQCAPGETCTADHACLACQSNANCGGTTPICDTLLTGRCVQCLDSRNCNGVPGAPLCDPATLTCVPVP